MSLVIYTDGACKGNPGVGGWGYYIVFPNGKEHKNWGGTMDTTNNRMELMALIQALKSIHPKISFDIIVYSDSKYLINTMTQGWKPKKNIDLWNEIDMLVKRHFIEWRWVKGHSGNYGNEEADKLANKFCFL